MTKTIKAALAGAGAFGLKHLDANRWPFCKDDARNDCNAQFPVIRQGLGERGKSDRNRSLERVNGCKIDFATT
jgi:hypothetical protein